jgi:hypothetical protein
MEDNQIYEIIEDLRINLLSGVDPDPNQEKEEKYKNMVEINEAERCKFLG